MGGWEEYVVERDGGMEGELRGSMMAN